MQPFEQNAKMSQEILDTGMKSFAGLSTSMQTIGSEAADYSRKAFERAGETTEKVLSAKSLDKAMEIQSDYLKGAYEDFVAQSTKMGDLYAEMAKEAYKPYESFSAKTK